MPNSLIQGPKIKKNVFDQNSFSDNDPGIGLFDYQMVGDHDRMVSGDDRDGFRDDSFDESIDSVQFFGANSIDSDQNHTVLPSDQNPRKKSLTPHRMRRYRDPGARSKC